MVFDNPRSRSPRQHYVWSEKALSIVRSTTIPKKDGALVVQQLHALTTYPEKACWRLAERFGFRRPQAGGSGARKTQPESSNCLTPHASGKSPSGSRQRRARFI